MIRPATRSLPKPGRFEQPQSLPVVVNFHGGQVTSDAGLSLIAELDRKLQITSRLAGCFQDYRQINRMLHPIEGLIAQRIYRQIVEAHQGNISVSSTVGKGSIFTVNLPVQTAYSKMLSA